MARYLVYAASRVLWMYLAVGLIASNVGEGVVGVEDAVIDPDRCCVSPRALVTQLKAQTSLSSPRGCSQWILTVLQMDAIAANLCRCQQFKVVSKPK